MFALSAPALYAPHHHAYLRADSNLAASVRNLFDARVLEPSIAPGTALPDDLPQPGRSFYRQATYSL